MARWRLSRLLRRRRSCPECGHVGRQVYCDVCGYDLVAKTRAATPQRPTL